MFGNGEAGQGIVKRRQGTVERSGPPSPESGYGGPCPP